MNVATLHPKPEHFPCHGSARFYITHHTYILVGGELTSHAFSLVSIILAANLLLTSVTAAFDDELLEQPQIRKYVYILILILYAVELQPIMVLLLQSRR